MKGPTMDQTIALPTGEVGYSMRGEGPPLVVLHRDVVVPASNPFIETLAEHHSVYALDLPGFGRSPRPHWLRNVTQLASLTGHAIDALDLGPCPIVGLGFGGWVAADLATQAGAGRISELVLVSPWGVKPTSGEIADFVLFDLNEWASLGFHDPARYTALCGDEVEYEVMRAWDSARESLTAVAWKPIGHSRQLRAMLPLVSVPTLVAWGAEDAIVPASCAKDWQHALAHGTVVVIPDAGHHVDLEAPEALAKATADFIRTNRTLEPR